MLVWEELSVAVLDEAVGLFKFNHSRSVGGGVRREAVERDDFIAMAGIETTAGCFRSKKLLSIDKTQEGVQVFKVFGALSL